MAAEYDGSIRINTKIDTKDSSVQLSSLQNQMVKTADKIASLRSKMDALGKAKIPTAEYKALEQEAASLEKKLLSVYDRQEKLLETGGRKSSTAYKRMAYDAEQLEIKLRSAEAGMERLVKDGKAFTLGKDSEKYSDMSKQLKYAENDMERLLKKQEKLKSSSGGVSNSYKKLSKSGKSAFSSMAKGAGKVKSALSKMGSIAARVFSVFGRGAKGAASSTKSLQHSLKTILKYGFAIRSLYALMNKLRSAMKDGFSNMYNGVPEFKNTVDGLRASLLTMKNALASAFAPIVSAAIPYIKQLVDWITVLLDKVAQFMAAITGQNTYTKAVKLNTSAVQDNTKANEKNKKQLSRLDKLNNLTSDKNNKDKTSNPAAGMFETAKVSNKIKNLAKEFKKSLKDLEKLGKDISTSLSKAMEKIKWEKIYKKAQGFGKGLADFLNGMFTGETGNRLFDNLGKTIAGLLNTVLYAVFSFSSRFKWSDFGKALGHGINGFFDKVKIKLAAKTVSKLAKGILDALIGVVRTVKWGDIAQKIADFIANVDVGGIMWRLGKLANSLVQAFYQVVSKKEIWSNLGKKIADGINGFFKGMAKVDTKTGLSGWEALGKSISDTIIGIADMITTALDGVNWEDVGKAIAQFLRGIKWKEIFVSLAGVVKSAFVALFKTAIGMIKEDPGAVINAVISVFTIVFAYKKLKSLVTVIKGSFGNIFKSGVSEGIQEKVPSIGSSSKIKGVFTKLGKTLGKVFSTYFVSYGIAEGVQQLGEALKENGKPGGKGMDYAKYAVGDSASFAGDHVKKLLTLDAEGLKNDWKKIADSWGGTVSGGDINLTVHLKGLDKKSANAMDELKKKMDEMGVSAYKQNTVLGKVRKALDSHTISSKELSKATKKLKKDTSELTDGLNLDEKMISLYMKSLKKNTDSLKISASGYKDIQKKVNQEIKSGTLSYGGFARITKKTYKSSKELYDEIKKIAGQRVAASIKAIVDGKKDVDDLGESIKKTKGKDVDIKAKTKGKEEVDSLNKSIDKTKSKSVDVKANQKGKKDVDALNSSINKTKTKKVDVKANAKGKSDVDKLNNAVDKSKDKTVTVKAESDYSGIRGMLKVLIGFVNIAVEAINKALSFDIPDWVPAIGGKHFGVNIPPIKIPAYATGQVIPKTMKQHLALLGDNNRETEVVSPLSTIEQAVGNAMKDFDFGGGVIELHSHVMIDGRELGQTIQKISLEHLKRTGKPIVAY